MILSATICRVSTQEGIKLKLSTLNYNSIVRVLLERALSIIEPTNLLIIDLENFVYKFEV